MNTQNKFEVGVSNIASEAKHLFFNIADSQNLK